MARAPFNPIGTTALVTGASSGLGIGYAHQLAERGADLVLVARRQDRLEALAVELAEKYGTVSTVIPLDLARADAVPELVADLEQRDISVGTLVNSAGFGTYGNFVDLDPARELEEITVNVSTLTALTQALLPGLLSTAISNPHGAALVNLGSTASFQPVPHMAVYGASKAYVLSFTEALWYETRSTGLKVLAVCPGPVKTEFRKVAQNEEASYGGSLTVDDVMRTTFDALDRAVTPTHVVVGAQNRALARLVAVIPRRAVLSAIGSRSIPGRSRA
ncbi:MAG TPA: SDR family oxidoreductase [Glaciibacter sp.]|nr:SDR family oxidoreductase [Glaciibacter sp.]